MTEYPKILHVEGREITVGSAADEATYAPKADPAPQASAAAEEPEPEREGPTFGAAHEPHVEPRRAKLVKPTAQKKK
jgi:hypothetical protein